MPTVPHPDERRAARHLQRRGWRVLARNWRGGGGELDLVVRRGSVLAFVEVKARSDPRALTEPHRSPQRRRMRRAATAYLARHPPREGTEVRFDLVTIRTGGLIRRPVHLPHGAED